MSKLGIWSKIFGKWMPKSGVGRQYAQYQSMNGYTAVFRGFGDNAYESDIVRATVHAIATNAAKLKPRHIRRLDGEMRHPANNVEKLLSLRPNPYMNAYDFFYKVVTQLYMRSNAFILIQSNGSRIVGFYPIVAQSAEALEYENELYLKFYFAGGKQLTVHYDEVVHLRRHYNESDIFGDSGDRPLLPTLELINTTNQGIMNAIKTSAFLRGILKFTAMLSPTDMKRQRDEFVKDYMDINNNGGVAATDSKMEYVKLDNTPLMVDSKQMDLIEKKVYKFFNVHEGIVTSKYTEDEWNAFYESVLEPLAVQMSLEFTSKVFTSNEQAHGNEVMFESNRLQYASNTTKTNIIIAMMDRGIMSMNEAREVFNMGPIEGGDKRIVSLNFVDVDKANQYQVGEPDGKEVDQENDDEDKTEDG